MQAEHLGVSLGLRAPAKKASGTCMRSPSIGPWCGCESTPAATTNLPKPAALQFLKQRNYCRPPTPSLKDGTVNYNDQQIPLAAELDDFKASVQFDAPCQQIPRLAWLSPGLCGNRRHESRGNTPLMWSSSPTVMAWCSIPSFLVPAGRALTARLNVAKLCQFRWWMATMKAVIVTQEIAEILKNPSPAQGRHRPERNSQLSERRERAFSSRRYASPVRLDSQALAVRSNQICHLAALHPWKLSASETEICASRKLDADVLKGHLSPPEWKCFIWIRRPTSSVNASLRGASLSKVSATRWPANTRQKRSPPGPHESHCASKLVQRHFRDEGAPRTWTLPGPTTPAP